MMVYSANPTTHKLDARPAALTARCDRPQVIREQSGLRLNPIGGNRKGSAPESTGPLLKCGLGYILCSDNIGLFFPKHYEAWFKGNLYAVEEFDDFEADSTILDKPFLALGAIVETAFEKRLTNVARPYLHRVAGD